MSYLGYRLVINNTTIPNDLIQKGTYTFTKEKRIASSWKDAQLVEHHRVLSNRKAVITFSVRERNLTEQETIKGIFATQENIPVTYWDDFDCEYKSSYFFMSAPKVSHRNTIGGINYAATAIQLTEY